MSVTSKDAEQAAAGVCENVMPREFSRLSLFSSASSTSQDEQFRSERHAVHSLLCMQRCLEAGQLCDVTLIAGNDGKRVVAHR